MPFSVKKQGDVGVVSITGRFLGAPEGAAYNAAINELRDGGVKNVVIDLSKADMMDSTAIGLTIRTLTTMRSVEGNVVIAALNHRIKNLFVMTRLLGPVFTNYDTVAEAVASFEEA